MKRHERRNVYGTAICPTGGINSVFTPPPRCCAQRRFGAREHAEGVWPRYRPAVGATGSPKTNIVWLCITRSPHRGADELTDIGIYSLPPMPRSITKHSPKGPPSPFVQTNCFQRTPALIFATAANRNMHDWGYAAAAEIFTGRRNCITQRGHFVLSRKSATRKRLIW